MNPKSSLRTIACVTLLWLGSVPSCSYDYDKFSSEQQAKGGQSNTTGNPGGTNGTVAQGGQQNLVSTIAGTTNASGGAIGTTEGSGGSHATSHETSGGATSSGGSVTALGGASTNAHTTATSLGGTSGTDARGTSSTNVAGSTAAPCLPPRIDCNGTCTELSSDAMNCGSCGRACSDSPAEWAVCLGGLCSCDKGATKCAADRECVRNNRCQAE